MEFRALDSNFNLVALLDPHNVQWNRKYYECGTYALEITQDQYTPDMKYIYCAERPETGIIQKVAWSGGNITLEGYFLEKILDDKIIYPTFYGSGDLTTVLSQMVNTYKEDLPIDTIQALNNASKVDFQETGMTIGEKLYEVLQTQEMSFRLLYNFEKNNITLQFYQGTDRTQESGNNFVTFSTLYDNVIDTMVDTDDSNYKNYALVAGQDSGENRVTVEVDLSNGGYKKKIFIDERQTQQSQEQTLDQYKLELYQKGLEKLLGYEFNSYNVQIFNSLEEVNNQKIYFKELNFLSFDKILTKQKEYCLDFLKNALKSDTNIIKKSNLLEFSYIWKELFYKKEKLWRIKEINSVPPKRNFTIFLKEFAIYIIRESCFTPAINKILPLHSRRRNYVKNIIKRIIQKFK